MKKVLLVLVAMFAMVGIAAAKNPVSVTSGSLLELKKSNAKIFLVYDYAKETLDGKSVADYIAADKSRSMEKLTEERKSAESYVAESFQKLTKNGLTEVSDEKDADYTLTIHFGNFNYGNAGVAFLIGFGAGDGDMSGTATLTKKGTTVAELAYNEIPIDGMDSNKSIREWGYIFFVTMFDRAITKSK